MSTTETKTKERIYAARTDADLDPEEVLDKANDAMKSRWLGIFIQLTNSHRFNSFIEDNYDIQDLINEEEKSIETRVIEKPIAVGPPLTSTQLDDMRTVLRLHGAKDVDDLLNSCIRILGQGDEKVSRLVTSASDSDVKDAAQELRDRLDA